jgi:capsular polysaccharide biosynthesis protein
LLRILESFFRRWWLYLVPVVVLAAIGFVSVSGTKKTYESSGTFNVENSTILSNLSGDNSQTNGFDTPATATSKRINATLQTDQFITEIAKRAGIDGALANGTITPGWIRSSLTSTTNGANLVRVIAVNQDPAVAQRLAQGTIDAFTQSIIDSASSQSTAAVTFFDNLLTTYQTNVANAQKAVDDYVAGHPAPAIGVRPEDEQAELTRLTTALTQAQGTYNATLGKRQDAELSTEQTKADMGQRLRLVDAPQQPVAPQARLKSMIFGFGTFLAVGILISLGAVVLATMMNHNLQTADDVKNRLGMRLLAIVPDASGRRPAKVKPAKTAKQPKVKAPKPAAQPPVPTPTRNAQVKPLKPAAVRKPAAASSAPTPAARNRAATARHVGRASGSSGWPN